MRVLFCGGGTAGHVYPAVAVAETIMRNSGENKVAYVVTENGIENKIVKFKKYSIDVVGFKRKLSFKNLMFFWKQVKAIEKCKDIIREFHPDLVFGTGGYATYPVAVAAKKLGIKVVLHESNAIPGKAIQSLQKKADKILINFDETRNYLKCDDKILRTGNPLRNDFEIYSKEAIRKELKIQKKFIIFCMGGSLGAKRINDSAVELIDNFIRHRDDIFLILSTGKSDYCRTVENLKKRGLLGINNVQVSEYLDNAPQVIAAADIVISRAGAMTISELAYTKKASILVPSPNVTNNHQYINANSLHQNNASIMITEDRLFTLIETVKELIDNHTKRHELENSISSFSVEDANKRIYNVLLVRSF